MHTDALRNMFVCLLRGDDAGSADGAAQLAAWFIETAREARAITAKPEPAALRKPEPTDAIILATQARIVARKNVRAMGPAVEPEPEPDAFYCDCHPSRSHASLADAETCEAETVRIRASASLVAIPMYPDAKPVDASKPAPVAF